MRSSIPARSPWRSLALASAMLLAARTAGATDGGHAPPDPEGSSTAESTYYESTVGSSSVAALASADPTLPESLAIDGATATAVYQIVSDEGGSLEWELRIDDFARRHERVDAIYDMVLVLPMPVGADGREAFEALQRGVLVEEGSAADAVPMIYDAEKVVLKRNVGLEKTLVRGLVAAAGTAGTLPDLAGTGYRYTAWDTIVQRDSAHADVVQGRGRLRYETASGVAPPDPDDPRMAAYLITWIPSLPGTMPPYAVRIDVRAPAAP